MVIHQFSNPARLQDRYDAVDSEPASAGRTPDVDPARRCNQ